MGHVRFLDGKGTNQAGTSSDIWSKRAHIMIRPVGGGQTELILVLNWFEELRARVRD